jgi:RNA polymerase sigma-70 factor (ECF subfamily)
MDEATQPGAVGGSAESSGDLIREALERYESRLIRYAGQLLGDLDTARDVVQDTFLTLVRADPREVGDHLGAWLFTVCRNRSLDILRKEHRMQRLDDVAVAAQAAPEPGPSALAEIMDVHARVLAVLATLPPNQQEVVRLKFHGELSYREISRITGLSESNVGYLIHVAVRTVRQRLQAAEAAVLPGAQGAAS